MFRTPQKSVRWRVAPVALLLTCFLGALEIHPAGDAHDFAAAARQTHCAVFSCPHPTSGSARHVHAATARELPPCPACLLRMQEQGLHFAAAVPLAAPAPGGRLYAESDPATGRISVDPRDARGPPAA